jgi:hypothetical protein
MVYMVDAIFGVEENQSGRRDPDFLIVCYSAYIIDTVEPSPDVGSVSYCSKEQQRLIFEAYGKRIS